MPAPLDNAMVASNPTKNQRTIWRLLFLSLGRLFGALAIGLLIWIVVSLWLNATYVPVTNGRLALLLLVIAQQIGFLLVAIRFRQSSKDGTTVGRAIFVGVLAMAPAALLGVAYDVLVRWLLGTATLGPWGELRQMDVLLASVIFAHAVSLGPAADELFFRAELFGAWQAEDRPWSGALLSSGAFALSRLDIVNIPAYFGLGLLLCCVYRWSGSWLAVGIGHALLNAVMLVLLFSGYE